ncbi:Fe-hydrogenase-1 [Giardia muris]|uniref:Fe-hydrogenase-1 n=1 Tax=Giardia muris TaxID=5742 RepID=A0A4Z1T7D7_GIAMU|nr:Fe-hydrogenase-1 [Giardia muris]|eukprot:TNJ28479.1 Fe-hydrogenase-1 [Giardia muris]
MPPKPVHDVTGTDRNNAIFIDYAKCIGCNMCVKACDAQAISVYRANEKPRYPPVVKLNTLFESDCIGCGQCTTICPVDALIPRDNLGEYFEEGRKHKVRVALIAPSVRVAFGDVFGLPIGTNTIYSLIRMLKKHLGFDYVFDVNFGADETTVIDTQEILHFKAEGKGPVFTSCCPAWINMAEMKFPELLGHVSTAKSCVAMVATLVKRRWAVEHLMKKGIINSIDDVYVADIMPCTAKKDESMRPQLEQDVNICLTIREVAEYLLHTRKVTLSLEEVADDAIDLAPGKSTRRRWDFDEPFNRVSGGSHIFGKTGGVAETCLRFISYLKRAPIEDVRTELVKEFKIPGQLVQTIKSVSCRIAGTEYKALVAHGGTAIYEAARMVRDKEVECDVVEQMACTGGCLNGGGMPKIKGKRDIVLNRATTLDQLDANESFASAGENKALWGFNGCLTPHEAHELLHTHYTHRIVEALQGE